MREGITPQRLQKITSAAVQRQADITLVLENIHDPHNVGAILRTCDAAGIKKIISLYTLEKAPKLSKACSASAFKWVERQNYSSAKLCYSDLKNDGYKIYSSVLAEGAKKLSELDLTQKVAIVLGNEHRGVSYESAEASDDYFYIPMHGFVESLNVSVAAAVILYEAERQRAARGMYDSSRLSPEELQDLMDRWSKK